MARCKNQIEGAKANPSTPAKSPATLEILRRQRNGRLLFVGLIAISFPILEAIAYQYRTVTIKVVNRSKLAVKGLKLTYSGRLLEVPEMKPGESVSRLIRPDYTFTREHFSTYPLSIRFATEDGQIFGQIGRVGTIDFSPTEIYTIIQTPPEGQIQLQHDTRPGFPLSLVRDLMERLGFG